jgi:hypothetical protein
MQNVLKRVIKNVSYHHIKAYHIIVGNITFLIWFLPRESILSFAMPFKGIMRSIELVDSARRLIANVKL